MFDKRRRGAAGQQYAIIVGLIAAVAIVAVTASGTAIKRLFENTGTTLELATNGATAGGGGAATGCAASRASCAAHLAAGCATSGAYSVAGSTLWCDMTDDGGGWTLVFKAQAGSAALQNNTGAVGGPSACLNTTADSCTAKVDDATINAIAGSNAGGTDVIAYRVTSNQISNRYFFSRQCVYAQAANNIPACQKYLPSYAAGIQVFRQCNWWGGNGGGLNAWLACPSAGGWSYSNVVVTQGTASPEITTNAAGNALGNSGTQYGNSVLMWVK